MTRVPPARLVCLVLLVPLVLQVKLVPRALTGSPDPLALVAARETRVHLAPLDAKEARVHQGYP